MDRYEIDIFWSDEDECVIAVVPDLVGCSVHGSTAVRALEEVTGARDLWLEAHDGSDGRCLSRGVAR